MCIEQRQALLILRLTSALQGNAIAAVGTDSLDWMQLRWIYPTVETTVDISLKVLCKLYLEKCQH